MSRTIVMQTLDDLDVIANIARVEFERCGKCVVVLGEEAPEERQRTISQNKSLHKYCDTIAGKMNDAGLTQRELVGRFREGFELPVTMGMIKDIFREVGKAMFKKESTKDLTTIEVKKVYEVVDQRFGEITGVRAEWPSLENQMSAAMGARKK